MPIIIINATWGYHGYWIDVTNLLNAAIDPTTGVLTIAVNPETLGDPCLGWVKELNVIYKYNGTNHQILVQERPNRILTINNEKPTTNTHYPGILKISGLV